MSNLSLQMDKVMVSRYESINSSRDGEASLSYTNIIITENDGTMETKAHLSALGFNRSDLYKFLEEYFQKPIVKKKKKAKNDKKAKK